MSLEAKAATPRRRRRDTGPRIVERDLAALTWIAQQYAIRLDHLCILLARLTQPGEYAQAPKVAGRLSEKRTLAIVHRWQDRDLIHKEWILHGEPPWIWLTQEGLRLVAEEAGGAFRPHTPLPSVIRHLYYCNHARLFIEGKRKDAQWTSDRELRHGQRSEQGKTRPHIPDGKVATNGKILAIEVELTVKAPATLAKILAELAVSSDYATVWYFTRHRTTGAVKQAIASLSEKHRSKFVVYDLDEMPL